jgi:zinc D-Ala-D-Ala carboxypeptidase
MSRRTDESPSVVKSIPAIVSVTLTVIVLVTCAANLRAKSPASPNDRTAVSTEEVDPTEVAWSIASNAGMAATEAVRHPAEDSGRITAADGFLPADVTLSPFDVNQPAVGNLNPDLLAAIQQAATVAENDGIDVRINSGWRSARYQQQLLNQAVIKYGSEQAARKWVDTPALSSHVAGNAVDIAPTAADDWLMRNGSRYGLCQIYANEIWHFELAVAPGEHCPAPKADASDG